MTNAEDFQSEDAYKLASEFSDDFLNFNHILNRAYSLVRQGWVKAEPETVYAVRWGNPEEIEGCRSIEEAIELRRQMIEDGSPEATVVQKKVIVVCKETPWEAA